MQISEDSERNGDGCCNGGIHAQMRLGGTADNRCKEDVVGQDALPLYGYIFSFDEAVSKIS
jgi:hypothetical protein